MWRQNGCHDIVVLCLRAIVKSYLFETAIAKPSSSTLHLGYFLQNLSLLHLFQ